MRTRILLLIAIALISADLITRVPTATAHSGSAPFARFAQFWSTHGGGLSIGPHGNGSYHLRAYANCSATILTDCDRFKGNYIYPGAWGTFSLTRAVGNTIKGTITNSSTSWEIDTQVSFTLKKSDVLVGHGASDFLGGRNFCGPNAPAGACGA